MHQNYFVLSTFERVKIIRLLNIYEYSNITFFQNLFIFPNNEDIMLKESHIINTLHIPIYTYIYYLGNLVINHYHYHWLTGN